ncbi:MAG: hypothetical protein KDC26_03880 [Armatimonadetes bacterium]|nr:hypothetical protein [Armatimonadota bacterium]
MPNVVEEWKDAVPEMLQQVTGVGVWTAIRACVPITVEDGNLVVGLESSSSDLAGHLKLPQIRKVIEDTMTRKMGDKMTLYVLNGTTESDWVTEKQRIEERRRLQEHALQRQKKEIAAGRSWDSIYEDLSRAYANTPNRTLPQNRAKYFMQAVEIVGTALIETPITDDLAERNYARCLERISKYCELPSAFVALKVLERTFQG